MKQTLLSLALMGSGILLSACGGSSSTTNTDSSINVSIPFKAVAGSQPISCGETLTGLGNGAGGAGTDIKLADFRMFVHDIKVITDQNIEIPLKLDAAQSSQNADVALLDFRDKAEIEDGILKVCAKNNSLNTVDNPNYNDVVKGSVLIEPTYSISHIQFTVGVPFDLNHQNPTLAEEPLYGTGLALGMTWNWLNGYKFAAFDVINEANATWHIHIGSTGCSVAQSDLSQGIKPEPCLSPARAVVKLPIGPYELDDIAIQLDYAALVSSSNLSEDKGGPIGCMSKNTDPECAAIFENLGLISGIEQSIFSIVALSER